VLTLLGLLLTVAGAFLKADTIFISQRWFENLVLWSGVACLLRALLWLPFVKHEAQEKRHEKQIKQLNNDASSRRLKLENDSCIADYFKKLERKTDYVQNISWNQWDEEEEKELSDLIAQIDEALKSKCGPKKSALFLSMIGFVEPPRRDGFIPNPKEHQWKYCLARARHLLNNLKTILEEN
jgi:hypothetical protein